MDIHLLLNVSEGCLAVCFNVRRAGRGSSTLRSDELCRRRLEREGHHRLSAWSGNQPSTFSPSRLGGAPADWAHVPMSFSGGPQDRRRAGAGDLRPRDAARWASGA